MEVQEKVYSLEIKGTDSVIELKNAIEELKSKLDELNESSKEYQETLEKLTELQNKLAEAMESVADSAERTNESIDEIRESIEDVGETIAEVSEKFDDFGNVDTDVIDAFVDGFIEGMNEAGITIDNVTGELDKLENTELDGLNNTIDGVKDHLDDVVDSSMDVKESIDVINDVELEEANDKIGTITETISDISNVTEKAKDDIDGINDVDLDGVKKNIDGVTEGLNGVTESLDGVIEGFGDVKDGLGDVTESIGEITGTAEQAKDSIDSLNETDLDIAKETVSGVVDNIDEISKSTDKAAESFDVLNDIELPGVTGNIDKINESLDTVTENTTSTKETIETLNDTNLDGVKDTVESVVDSIADISNATEETKESIETINDTDLSGVKETLSEVTEGIDEISTKTEGTKETIEGLNDTNLDGIKETVGEVYESVEDTSNTVKDVKENLEGLNDIDLDTATDKVDKVSNELENVNDTIESVSEGFSGIKDGVESLTGELDGAKSGLEEIAGEAENAKDKIDGLNDTDLSGAKEEIGSVVDELNDVKDSTTETAENFSKLGDASSVKELKDQINELRDRLVSLKNGSQEYKDTVDELISRQIKLKEVMNAGKNEVHAAEGSYNALSQKMSALKQIWKETTDEATRNEIGKQINEINNQLKEFDSSIGNNQRNVGNYKSALEGLDGSFSNLKQELKATKDYMEQLDPATQEYADAMARAAEITHQLSDQQEMIKYSSADVGDQLSNMRGIASNLAAGYSALNAAMGLFGAENDNVKEAMLKVQQAMALVQGLQGLDGFIKRTKGLSNAMKAWTKETKASTVATKASATASMQDAAAKGAEATATASVVPAQLSLNAAMKANPIGFIIGLIASLIAAFSLLKDKIKELIDGNEKLTKAFNKVKTVAAGFGNVLKKHVINPIKLAFTPLKTLGKVLYDVFTLNWSDIKKDIKDGAEEVVDIVKDSVDVVGSFREGMNKKEAELNEAARQKEAAARKKDLDDQIKDAEAKYGAEWKYTEEGKKTYEAYFASLAGMYKKDSDEYKQALRDKENYEREYAEKELELIIQSKNAELALEESKHGSNWKWTKEGKKFYDDYYDSLASHYAEDSREYKKYMDQKTIYDNNFTQKAKDNSEALRKKQLSDFKSSFSELVPEMDTANIKMLDLFKKWMNGVKAFRDELVKTYGFSAEKALEVTGEMQRKFTALIYDNVAGVFRKGLEKDIYNFDKTLSSTLSRLQEEYNKKKIIFGIQFPEDELRYFNDVFEATMKTLHTELKKVNGDIETVFNELKTQLSDGSMVFEQILGKNLAAKLKPQIDQMLSLYSDYQKALLTGEEELIKKTEKAFYNSSASTEVLNALGLNMPELQKLLDQRNNLVANMTKAEIENAKSTMDVVARIYKKSEENERNYYETRLSQMELSYNKEKALEEKRSELFSSRNEVEEINKKIEYEQQYFNTLIELYQKQRDRYTQMSKDMTLTAEERENASREAVKITGMIIEEDMKHQEELIKNQIDLIKAWKNAAKDLASGVSDAFGNISSYYEGVMSLSQMKIDQQLKEGKINQQQAEKMYEQQKDAFEKSKKFQAAQTMINGLSAAIGAYESLASIPYVGPFLGAAAAAAALAAAIVNVQKINATQFDNPYSSSSSSSGNFQLPDVMQYEPAYYQNTTGQSNIDNINNGNGEGGRGEPIECFVVESQITAKQELANRRKAEATF